MISLGSPRTMNRSNCSFSELRSSPAFTYFTFVYLGLLLALGLPLNGLALWVFCCRLRRWTEAHVYMVNLAVADFCLLCVLPFMLYSLKDHSEDTPFCQVSQGIYLTNRYMSISLIVAIAVDRYVAVRHPLYARGLRSPRRAAAVCVVLWVLVMGSLVLRWLLREQEGGFCFSNRSRHSPYTVAFSLLGFYLPLAVLVFCSLQLATALGQRPDTDSGQAEATRKAARMVWANLAVFLVCFLPLHVVLTWRLATGLNTCAIHDALHITSKFSDANCCLDAICYYYMAREFQEASPLASLPTAKAPKSQDSVCMTLS
ncbi:PREDICTED: G-protein coupled receptor 35 isoform X2 [Hipposideros armiger]|uniref:G-protein coupled receptor 35 isoform X2 n=1 Tax=Hipposideros armiger TaxID=186990 RepID=A0A8B7Q6E1_HIPAR|nr:PREDICTED: G-protein coupled receptor 35 isoform X2 [Hipposideros armiger]